MIIDKRMGHTGGYTYSGLLVVLQQCTDFPNKRAAVLCGHDEAARLAMRMCFEMVTPLLGSGFATFFPQRRIIQFKNGSEVHFITPSTLENRMRGMSFKVGMIDNSVSGEANYPVQALRAMVRD